MAQRTLKIIVVLLILNPSRHLFAQNAGQEGILKKIDGNPKAYGEKATLLYKSQQNVEKSGSNFLLYPVNMPFFQGKASIYPSTGAYSIPPTYYSQCLGFFCRQELKWDQHNAVPLRLRLGSIDYVNRLEGLR